MNRSLLVKFIGLSLIAKSAFASNGDTPVSQGLRYITDAITGSTGIALSTVAIMVVGLLCLGHYLKWMHLVYTIAGISIIFGASSIVNGIKTLIH